MVLWSRIRKSKNSWRIHNISHYSSHSSLLDTSCTNNVIDHFFSFSSLDVICLFPSFVGWCLWNQTFRLSHSFGKSRNKTQRIKWSKILWSLVSSLSQEVFSIHFECYWSKKRWSVTYRSCQNYPQEEYRRIDSCTIICRKV